MADDLKTLQYIEIDIDYCSLSYGVAPCPAVLGVDSAEKCYNTFSTCPVKASFVKEARTLRFAEASQYLPGDIPCDPSIKSISYTPQNIDPGKSMGTRASLSVTFDDHPTGDAFLDKYVNERDYNPWEQGTFFGKFRARNPFIRGRTVRFIQGTLGQTLDEMTTRYFIADTSNGPGADNTFQIVAKDPLKMADGDRAQAPRKSSGTLLLDIDEDDTSITLDPGGIGDAEYPAAGLISMGEEMCAFTRVADVMTITRHEFGSETASHNQGDLVQLCLEYASQTPSEIIYDLLVNYAEADPAQIPFDEWETEVETYINRVYGARIGKPTAVSDLINEIIEEVGLVFFWDEEQNLIKLQSLRPVTPGDQLILDDSMILSTLKVSEQPEKRVSQVWTSFAQINPLEDLGRESNFASGAVNVDLEAETNYQGPAIYKVMSRWMDRFNLSGAQRLNAQILSRYRDPPRRFQFACDRFQNTLRMGRGFRFSSRLIQDAAGRPQIIKAIVKSLKPSFDRFDIEAEEMLFQQSDDLEAQRLIVIDQDSIHISLRAVHDSIYTPPVGGEDVLFIVQNGVAVGGSTAIFPSLYVGEWPPGVTLTLINNGEIFGVGGAGGNFVLGGDNGLGGPGGTAIYTRYPITIDNTVGHVLAGGGGGGAAVAYATEYIGGGGGAGFYPGPHGGFVQGRQNSYWDPGSNATKTAGGRGGQGDAVISGHGNNFTNWPGNGGNLAEAGHDGYVSPLGSPGTHNAVRAGGAAGKAVDGDSYITWTATGLIIGDRIN